MPGKSMEHSPKELRHKVQGTKKVMGIRALSRYFVKAGVACAGWSYGMPRRCPKAGQEKTREHGGDAYSD